MINKKKSRVPRKKAFGIIKKKRKKKIVVRRPLLRKKRKLRTKVRSSRKPLRRLRRRLKLKRRIASQPIAQEHLQPQHHVRHAVVVGYVNRPDLLVQALHSIEPLWPHTTVIDNSNKVNLTDNPIGLPVKVYQPPDPLSFSQTMNLMHRTAAERGAEVGIFMHNDAELHPGMADRLLDTLDELKRSGCRWGALRTLSPALTAYNMEAVRAIGPMDTVLPHDFAEQDYFKRMSLLGFETVESDIHVTHYNDGSTTYKSDEELHFIRETTRPFYLNYYQDKWGGPPGSETHTLLFGEFPLNPIPNYLSKF